MVMQTEEEDVESLIQKVKNNSTTFADNVELERSVPLLFFLFVWLCICVGYFI